MFSLFYIYKNIRNLILWWYNLPSKGYHL